MFYLCEIAWDILIPSKNMRRETKPFFKHEIKLALIYWDIEWNFEHLGFQYNFSDLFEWWSYSEESLKQNYVVIGIQKPSILKAAEKKRISEIGVGIDWNWLDCDDRSPIWNEHPSNVEADFIVVVG